MEIPRILKFPRKVYNRKRRYQVFVENISCELNRTRRYYSIYQVAGETKKFGKKVTPENSENQVLYQTQNWSVSVAIIGCNLTMSLGFIANEHFHPES